MDGRMITTGQAAQSRGGLHETAGRQFHAEQHCADPDAISRRPNRISERVGDKTNKNLSEVRRRRVFVKKKNKKKIEKVE